MRDAAMVVQVFNRPDEGNDVIEVGRGSGKKAEQHAPPERQRCVVRALRGSRPREQRARKRMGQGIHRAASYRARGIYQLELAPPPPELPPPEELEEELDEKLDEAFDSARLRSLS